MVCLYNSSFLFSCIHLSADANGRVREKVLPKALDLDRPKRARTNFSQHQLSRLESEFQRNHYMVGQDRARLASSLQLSEAQVRWEMMINLGLLPYSIHAEPYPHPHLGYVKGGVQWSTAQFSTSNLSTFLNASPHG